MTSLEVVSPPQQVYVAICYNNKVYYINEEGKGGWTERPKEFAPGHLFDAVQHYFISAQSKALARKFGKPDDTKYAFTSEVTPGDNFGHARVQEMAVFPEDPSTMSQDALLALKRVQQGQLWNHQQKTLHLLSIPPNQYSLGIDPQTKMPRLMPGINSSWTLIPVQYNNRVGKSLMTAVFGLEAKCAIYNHQQKGYLTILEKQRAEDDKHSCSSDSSSSSSDSSSSSSDSSSSSSSSESSSSSSESSSSSDSSSSSESEFSFTSSSDSSHHHHRRRHHHHRAGLKPKPKRAPRRKAGHVRRPPTENGLCWEPELRDDNAVFTVKQLSRFGKEDTSRHIAIHNLKLNRQGTKVLAASGSRFQNNANDFMVVELGDPAQPEKNSRSYNNGKLLGESVSGELTWVASEVNRSLVASMDGLAIYDKPRKVTKGHSDKLQDCDGFNLDVEFLKQNREHLFGLEIVDSEGFRQVWSGKYMTDDRYFAMTDPVRAYFKTLSDARYRMMNWEPQRGTVAPILTSPVVQALDAQTLPVVTKTEDEDSRGFLKSLSNSTKLALLGLGMVGVGLGYWYFTKPKSKKH